MSAKIAQPFTWFPRPDRCADHDHPGVTYNPQLDQTELWRAYKSGPPDDPRRASPHTEGESDGWENAATFVRARADRLTTTEPTP